MSNQPYGYEPPHEGDHTQQWEGRTWDTQTQSSLHHSADAAETAYLPPVQSGQPLPPQAEQSPYAAPGTGGFGHQAHPGAHDGSGYGAPQGGSTGTGYGAPANGSGYGAPQGGSTGTGYGTPQGGSTGTGYGMPPQGGSTGTGYATPSNGAGTGYGAVPSAPGAADSTGAFAGTGRDTGAHGNGTGQSTDVPEYGAPTTTGNARITDAQRARAEGRSPVIEPGMQPAALTAVLGLLLASAAPLGAYALFIPLVALQALTAAGWFRLNGMWPARQGIALAFAGALTADVTLLAAGRENAPAAILGTLGVWVLLSLVLQLRSHASQDERMYGLMATVASAALAIVAAGQLAAAPEAVTVGGVAVAVAVLARALPLPTAASVVVALLAATGAGFAAGGFTGFGAHGALLGLGAGACALIGHRVASYDYPSRFVHMTAGIALPLTAAAPAVYLLGRVLG
ncbi:hypothetical protein ACWCP6_06115 [Streptomyces sp. NPDC002004]